MDLRDVYRKIPRRYESTNHLLTLGLDRPWRKLAAGIAVRSALESGEAGAGPWLDLCSGTGETAILLSSRSPGGVDVVSADFSVPMLSEGIRRRGAGSLIPVAASSDALPFPDATFGLVTVTFAARNLRSHGGLFRASLREIKRVLRPGGIFVDLETSQPRSALVRSLLHIYAGTAVGRLGRLLTGEKEGYAYLSGSIRSFPGAAGLAAEIGAAGFSGVAWKEIMFGVVAIHTAIA
jgi:demethylmenaquinone methyltransferase/2-methoxy-6-polyprenyl-1,4-benzoquinol methylase